MQKINSEADLKAAILQLEGKCVEEGKMLREQFHLTYESLKPINLIKSTFKQVAASPNLKDNVLNTSVGLTAGYISKLLFEGVSKNPFKKLLGSALLFGMTNIVAKNPVAIKILGKKFLKIVGGRSQVRVINGAGNNETK